MNFCARKSSDLFFIKDEMIPTICFRKIENEDTEEIARLREAVRKIGVFYLDAANFLTSGFFSKLFDQAEKFFNLPDERKKSIALANSPNFRGYVGFGEERTNGTVDLKESFEFAKEYLPPPRENPPEFYRLYGLNQMPENSWLPDFGETIEDYTNKIERIGYVILKSLALTLHLTPQKGSRSGYFAGDSCYFSRLIYYSNPFSFVSSNSRLETHTDHALFTIILQDTPGLEVKNRQGEWLEVLETKEKFVIFSGELTEFWTRGFYKACPHRVYNSALKTKRVSIASFFLPDLHSAVAPINFAADAGINQADLSVSEDNSWITKPKDVVKVQNQTPNENVLPLIVGEKEWERINLIFPE